MFRLAIGTLVVFELKTSGDQNHDTQLIVVELLAGNTCSANGQASFILSYTNKGNRKILGETLHAAGVALIMSSNEESNAFLFDEISLERTELNLSQMATMLVQFLGPCFADVTRGIDDNSTNVNERTVA
jgi:hypothetical protein